MGPSKYDLYGFETEVERELFRAMLKNCDRVGPAAAMRAMNIAPPQQLLQAIRLGNTKYFERGVGEKTAQQIVLGMGRWAANEAGLA
jgi:Holliday junction resolvasome RuvABC DNA-binding subunit